MKHDPTKKWHQILEVMALNWGLELTQPHYKLYGALLEKYQLEELESAANRLLADPEQTRMPNLNTFEKVLHGDPKSRVIQALTCLHATMEKAGAYKSVTFSDPALAVAVEICGGWLEMCRSYGEMDQDQVGYYEHRFREVYLQCLRDGKQPSRKYEVGLIEVDNCESMLGWTRGKLTEPKVSLVDHNGKVTEIPLATIEPRAHLAVAYNQKLLAEKNQDELHGETEGSTLAEKEIGDILT